MICFKLVSGEEIIAQVDTISDDSISVTEPVVLLFELDYETGEYGLNMRTFMLYTTEELFTFKNKDIIITTQPTEELELIYLRFLDASKLPQGSVTFH